MDAGLAEISTRVWFRHPLLRSAAYRSASLPERQAAHLALVEATDPVADPDRRAWHRAQAADGPDEEIAADLQRSAGRAQARGGPAAAAAFLEKAVLLTADPVRRADRLLAAAQANLQAGAYDHALQLVLAAESGPLEEMQSARADLLRGHIAFASGLGSDAPPLLLKAARQLQPLDLDLTRQTYLTAWLAAVFAGRLAAAGNLIEVCRAARELPRSERPGRLRWFSMPLPCSSPRGRSLPRPCCARRWRPFPRPTRRRRTTCGWAFASRAPPSPCGTWTPGARWSNDMPRSSAPPALLDQLPVVLVGLGATTTWAGDFAASAALIAESDAVSEATGTRAPPFAALMLPALRGDEAAAIRSDPGHDHRGHRRRAGPHRGLCQLGHRDPLQRPRPLLRSPDRGPSRPAKTSSGPCSSRCGRFPSSSRRRCAAGTPTWRRGPMASLAESARAGGTEFGLGIEARSRALLSEGETADRLYREAIERLSRTQYRPDLGRAHLLYGEWLRREDRRTEARIQLRAAYDLLSAIGAEAFAERARRELQATGERVLKRSVETRHHADRAGGPHRPAGPRRPHQPRDRRPAVPVDADGPVSPAQGLHQARDHLPPRTPPRSCPANS